MVALWILGILLALVIVILLIRVGLSIQLGESVRISACIGSFKLQILPKTRKKEKNGKQEKKGTAKESAKKNDKKKLGLTFSNIRSAAPALFASLHRGLRMTRRRLRIHPLNLCVTFGGDDPAKVAETYGWASCAMWTVLPQLENLTRMPNPHIHLDVDYNNQNTKAEGEVGLSFQIRDLFAVAFAFGIPLLQWFLAFRKSKNNRVEAAEKLKQANEEETKVNAE